MVSYYEDHNSGGHEFDSNSTIYEHGIKDKWFWYKYICK